MHKKIIVPLILLLVIFMAGCSESKPKTVCGDGVCENSEIGKCTQDCEEINIEKNLTPFTSPLYFTVVIHTEEDTGHCTSPKPQIPDYDGDEEVLLHFTMVMREFARMVASHNATINFGTDWTFAKGVELYDPSFFTDLQTMGHEIDAHGHQSCILYHELRQYILATNTSPTTVASGLEENNVYTQMSYFDNYYPEFQIFWGVAIAGHEQGEETSGWVWRPSRDNWLENDPDGKYIYIGHGNQINNITYIQTAIDNRVPNYINTYAVFTNPREFKASKETSGIPDEWTAKPEDPDYWENRLLWWDEFLTEIDKMKGVEYASLTEIADIFIQNEDNLDFNFSTSDHPRSDIPMPQKQKQAGYP
ncbi:MAG: hypothetical protein ABH842_03130 [Candidatus Micrarchaeota archaeon]